MLMLTRKAGQSIEISRGGDLIVVHVIEIKGKQVRLGTQAPASFEINREEIARRKEAGIPAPKKVPLD